MNSRNDPCWCGSGKKWKKCHFPEAPPENFASLAERYLKQWGIVLKNGEQIAKIRAASHLAADILAKLCKAAKAGVTTESLDNLAAELTSDAGAISASLGYGSPPYPKNICTSLNEVICHGIPDSKPLVEGDIVNIDYACILNGYYGDCSAMVMIGEVSEEKRRVVEVSHECLNRAVKILRPGIFVSAIGKEIEDYARANNCSVVNQFVGHGVGIHYHEAPQIPHHYNNIQIPLAPGMTFTIEPMINAGVRTAVIDEEDGWTARTADGRPSAQWEHTLLITDTGYEVLTQQ